MVEIESTFVVRLEEGLVRTMEKIQHLKGRGADTKLGRIPGDGRDTFLSS